MNYCTFKLTYIMCVFAASSHVGLDDFVEMTKKYAQGVAPSPVMAAAGGDDDEDDDDVVVKSPDELPLHQKVGGCQSLFRGSLHSKACFSCCYFTWML